MQIEYTAAVIASKCEECYPFPLNLRIQKYFREVCRMLATKYRLIVDVQKRTVIFAPVSSPVTFWEVRVQFTVTIKLCARRLFQHWAPNQWHAFKCGSVVLIFSWYMYISALINVVNHAFGCKFSASIRCDFYTKHTPDDKGTCATQEFTEHAIPCKAWWIWYLETCCASSRKHNNESHFLRVATP